LQHLREQRSRQTSFFQFSEGDAGSMAGDDDCGGGGDRVSSKDLTKYAYGVAKGMEYIVSKGVNKLILISFFT